MAVFVRLTHSTGEPMFVNPEMVIRFRTTTNGHTLIIFTKEDTVTVKESLEEVGYLLQLLVPDPKKLAPDPRPRADAPPSA